MILSLHSWAVWTPLVRCESSNAGEDLIVYFVLAAIGLLVGHRLHPPTDRENPARLVKEERLVGLRLSPIYDREVRWLDDPVCNPLWKKADWVARSTSSAPHQVGQVAAQCFPGTNIVVDHLVMIDIDVSDEDGFAEISSARDERQYRFGLRLGF